jgi:hypothetical protein
MLTFRQFVEQTKDAVHTLVTSAHADVEDDDERALTPMLHIENEDGVTITGVDPRFFDSLDARVRLVKGFVVPTVVERRAKHVAWTFEAWATTRGSEMRASENPDRIELVIGTFIDAERAEVWQAQLHRPPAGRAFVGDWQPWEPAATDGPLLITPIQEAMR